MRIFITEAFGTLICRRIWDSILIQPPGNPGLASLEVSITGFMNEQYAYKTSADVRRTFKHKRENGEFIGAFAPYGYIKDSDNKNALMIRLWTL